MKGSVTSSMFTNTIYSNIHHETDLGETDLGETDLGETHLGETDLGETDLGETHPCLTKRKQVDETHVFHRHSMCFAKYGLGPSRVSLTLRSAQDFDLWMCYKPKDKIKSFVLLAWLRSSYKRRRNAVAKPSCVTSSRVHTKLEEVVGRRKGVAQLRIFNLGNTSPVPVSELVSILEKLLKVKVKAIRRVMKLPRIGDVPFTHVNISLAQRDFGVEEVC
ncbi:putative UDP-glucuronate 4-epimerase [Helianthus annuus]|uniref:UDP-glucuronate 4-epimerase n=1 Tax=Helianthus annuus TaxID=4232 RepID=A0A9K3ELQ5_HELAN|nr:putative UDP-glucuronate 4-epimerase [Helianthus annuus]